MFERWLLRPCHHGKAVMEDVSRAFFFLELANFELTLEETTNKGVVLALYEALSSHDVVQVQKLLASDLEWWFHGPPSHQFLMRILTGTAKSDHVSFQFLPKTIDVFGSIVLVEGCDPTRSITWVHAWTVTDGRSQRQKGNKVLHAVFGSKFTAKNLPGGVPIISVKHEDIQMKSSFVLLYKVIPKSLGSIAFKEDVVLVLLATVADDAREGDVQTSFSKSVVCGEAVLVQEPHEGFDLIRNSKFPYPVVV
ncbi:Wound-induced protein 1 [Capsicum annuum]|nr:Wound-induced protein 1 [Capsicum annuum]KAF3658608.1 Wound-induced protein 1 [Capsicum annuum]